MNRRPAPRRRIAPRIEELEPRILFSADAAGLLADMRPVWDGSEAAQIRQAQLPAAPAAGNAIVDKRSGASAQADDEHRLADAMLQALANPSSDSTTHRGEIVFIDGSVSDRQGLLAALDPGVERVVLDSSRDGLAQMAAYLDSRSGLGAIHVISEGASGRIQLGASWLDTAALSQHSGELARIGAALAPGGDILFYGCQTAAGEAGEQFVAQLARMTHADIAASTDWTGSAAMGGNWTLERAVGSVEASTVFTTHNTPAYHGLLGTYTVTNANDSGAGSLRQAITSANANPGADSIVFSIGSGAKSIALLSSLPFITDTLNLDATTQPGFTSAPLIELNGTLSSGGDGLHLLGAGASGSTIRGFIINHSPDDGIEVESTSNVTIAGNYIGTDAAGTAAAGNTYDGIILNSSTGNTIGGTAAGDANVIAFNGNEGVYFWDAAAKGNAILGNSIHGNSMLGINFANLSPTNDLGDGDTGPNQLQNNPVLSSARINASASAVTWSFNSHASRNYRIEFFANASGSQGEIYLGFVNVTTDASGNVASTTTSGLAGVAVGDRQITATATDLTTNETSQFSAAVTASTAPYITNSGGATAYTENAAAIAIDATLTLSDPDSATLASATVSITAGFQSGADVLAFVNVGTTGNIVANYDGSIGMLILSSAGSTATLAQWQTALRAVSYANSSDTPSTATRTISFAASDATGAGAASTKSVSVTAVNDAPVLATSGTTAYTENGAALAIDPSITVTDVDSATLASVTASISANFASGEDLLAFTNDGSSMGNVTASYAPGTGVLTLSSSGATATLAQWQSALRAVTYANSSDNPSTANRTISFVANDGATNSSTATRTVSVASVNDIPVVTTSGGTTAYTENAAGVVIDASLTLADPDNATLASSTVSISANFASGEDLLAFTNDGSTMGNVAGGYNAATGVLTLTSSGATATLAHWQAALRAITYANSSDNPSTLNRTISFVASDGTASNSAATRTVSVASVNDIPVVTTSGGTTAYTENAAAVAIDASLTLADADNATLAGVTVSISSNFAVGEDLLAFTNDGVTMGNIIGGYSPATGVLTLTSFSASATLAEWQAALRVVTYADSSASPSTSNRTISFVANDAINNGNVAIKTVSVSAIGNAPVVTASGGTTAYIENGAALTIDGALTVSDADSSTLASVAVSISANFAAGEDLLAFANDGSTMGNVAGGYNAASGVLTLSSSGATATLAEWQAALRAVTYANSSDNPSTNNRSISFVANDGTASSTASIKTVSVAAVNDAPVVSSSAGTTAYSENGAPVAVDGALTVSDADSATLASVTVSISANFATGEDLLAFANDGSTMGNVASGYNATTGVLTLSSSGGTATLAQWQAALRAVTYANNSDNPSTAGRILTFIANDGASNSTPAAKTVSVAAVNDAPVVTTSGGSTAYTENGAAAAIDASIAVADVDSTTLANVNVSIITNLAAGEDLLAFINNGSTMGNIVGSYNGGSGLLALTSSGATATLAEWQSALRAVTYANSADNPSTSNRSISFVASDGTAGSASSTEAVSVAAVNDAPVVSSSAGTTAYSENGAPVAIDGALTVSDADSATLTSVSVSIGINFAAGEDLLAFTNDGSTMGNVAGSYNAGTGVLTLTSSGATATLAQWQAALRSVSYANSSDNPSTSGRVLSFVANDGTSSSAAAAKTVGVSAVNDPPFVTMSAGTLAYAGNGAVLAIDGALTVSDADTNTLANVSVSISANFASGEDVLAFTNDGSSMGDLTASYNAGSGVLTLSSPGGGATLVQWQAALRAVTFSTSASDGGAASRTIRFAVSDGAPASPPSIATLQIQLSTVVQVTWAAPGTEAGLPIAQTISTTPDARNETPFAAAPAAKATGPSQPAQATQDATEALARNPALPLHRIALLLSTPTASAEVRWRDEAQAASGSDTRFAFFDELLLPAERDGGSGAPAFNTAAYSTLSHRARNRHGEDEQPDATGNIEQQETSATLVKKSAALIAGATTLWSLRLSGLLASLFASRPLWTHLDPIPLLPPAQDEPEPLPQEAGDEEAAKDEVAAAQLLHDVAPGGRAS